MVRVHQNRDCRHGRRELVEEFHALRLQCDGEQAHSGNAALGRPKLATRPVVTGSPPTKTIGIVEVASLAARPETLPPSAAITATRRSTRSATSSASRSYRPSAQRYSIKTFWPTTDPASFKPAWNDARRCRFASGRPAVQDPDHWQCRLLCACRQRPHGRSTAKPCDELPTSHSITSSAWTNGANGPQRLIAMASP